MKDLEIQLNQDYRSFQDGFKTILKGDLIILSGVNGSGKSQFIDIIRRQGSNNSNIVADVKIDGAELKKSDIIYRSFKENINISDIHLGNINSVTSTKAQVWENYRQYRLDSSQKNLEQFKKSCGLAKDVLVKKFGEEKFNNSQITQEDIINTEFGDLIWRLDDAFSNFIGDSFFNYARTVLNEKVKFGDIFEKFDQDLLEATPWSQLNDLFRELKLEYRFKNGKGDYYLKTDFQLNEHPKLYQLKADGEINPDDPRNISDLSDGEKAIIALIFASFYDVKFEHEKILLLDEFDATFNPSLTEVFYKLIEKYFISKGILVVITTHSPATISMAPEHASFYEVFSKNRSNSRILPVQKDDYAELKLANKSFYEKIANQSNRINELESQFDKLKNLQQELNEITKPIIITEGKTDIKHLKKAKEVLGIDCDIDFSYEIPSIGWGSFQLKDCLEKISKISQKHKIIGIFDRDEKEFIDDIEKNGQQFKNYSNNVYAFCIPKPSSIESEAISIEHYYSDNILQKEDPKGRRLFLGKEFYESGNSLDGNYQTKIKTIQNKIKINGIIDDKVFKKDDLEQIKSVALSKSDFADLVEVDNEFIGEYDFDNFKLIFEKIKTIVESDSNENAMAKECVLIDEISN